MADNVRFLCDNGSGGTGYSGANGFPMAYDTSSVPNYHCPVTRSFHDCVEIWWRIKNWELTTDADITLTGTTNTMYSGVLTPDPGNATREKELIDVMKTHRFVSPPSSTDAFNFICTEIIGQSGSLYPQLELNTAVVAVGAASLVLRLFDPDPILGSATGSISGTVKGVSTPVYYWVLGSPDSFTFSTFILEPVEWWPYAQLSNGNPIYSTSTGAILGGSSPLN